MSLYKDIFDGHVCKFCYEDRVEKGQSRIPDDWGTSLNSRGINLGYMRQFFPSSAVVERQQLRRVAEQNRLAEVAEEKKRASNNPGAPVSSSGSVSRVQREREIHRERERERAREREENRMNRKRHHTSGE